MSSTTKSRNETKQKRARKPPMPKWQDELLLTIEDTAKVLHISRGSLYTHLLHKLGPDKKPLLFTVKIGQKRLVPVDTLREYIASLGKVV